MPRPSSRAIVTKPVGSGAVPDRVVALAIQRSGFAKAANDTPCSPLQT
jgi:stage V sporulation protein SpoVS